MLSMPFVRGALVFYFCALLFTQSSALIPSLQRLQTKVEQIRKEVPAQSPETLFAKKMQATHCQDDAITENICQIFKEQLSGHDAIIDLLLQIELELSLSYWNNQTNFLKEFGQLLDEYPAIAITFLKQKLKERYNESELENNQALIKLRDVLL